MIRAAEQFCELHRPEIPNLHADVELARQQLQSAVTVAMKVDPTFARIAPGPEGIVAQNEMPAVDAQLAVRLNGLPASAARHRGIIVVAGDQMFASMECRQKQGHTFRPLANGEVPQMPDLILAANDRIPPLDHQAIHLGHRCERTAVEAQCSSVAKVMITDKEG